MHYVQSLIFEQQTSQQEGATQQQSAISNWLKASFVPMMDDVFSELVGDEKIVRLDRLVVDVKGIETGISEEKLLIYCKKALKKALQAEISKLINTDNGNSEVRKNAFISKERAAYEAFVFFIEKGYFPPTYRIVSESAWLFDVLTALSEDSKLGVILRGGLLKDTIVQQRIIKQLPVRFLASLSQIIMPNAPINKVAPVFEKIQSAENQAILWLEIMQLKDEEISIIIQSFLEDIDFLTSLETESKEKIKTIFSDFVAQKLAKSNDKPKSQEEELQDTPSVSNENQTVFYIDIAGLALILPYLPMFFNKMDLLDGTVFKNSEAQEKGIQLLHYLATGRVDLSPDYDLFFEKWLCHYPIGMPTNRHNALNKNEILEADALLNAVIGNWTSLGTCSINGLRETFFKRQGKLSVRDDGHWQLTIERKTVDILLDRLPWSIGIIRLNWLKNLLFVEW
jgi:hypothetical protein